MSHYFVYMYDHQLTFKIIVSDTKYNFLMLIYLLMTVIEKFWINQGINFGTFLNDILLILLLILIAWDISSIHTHCQLLEIVSIFLFIFGCFWVPSELRSSGFSRFLHPTFFFLAMGGGGNYIQAYRIQLLCTFCDILCMYAYILIPKFNYL